MFEIKHQLQLFFNNHTEKTQNTILSQNSFWMSRRFIKNVTK